MRSIVVLIVALFLSVAGSSATQTQVGTISSPGVAFLNVPSGTLLSAYSTELGATYSVSSVTIEYVGSIYYLTARGTMVSSGDPFSTYTALGTVGSALYVSASGGQTNHVSCIGCAICWPEDGICVTATECGAKLCNSYTISSANGAGYIGSFY